MLKVKLLLPVSVWPRSTKIHSGLFLVAILCGVLSMVWALPERPSGYVTDEAEVVDEATRLRIETLLTELEQKTSDEVAVVTLTTLGDHSVEDVAVEIFKKWGIGKKGKNNGVLFLIAPNDRRMRIEVGYGLEGVLTDGRAGRLLDENVVPFFKAGQLSEGVFRGAQEISNILAQNAGVALSPEYQLHHTNPVPLTRKQKFFAFLILMFLFAILIRHPWLIWFFLSGRGGGRGGWSGGGFGGGGFGGFGGGWSGGGGSSRGW